MSKVIVSPVKEYPGTITLHDPFTYPMVIAFSKSSRAAKATDDPTEKMFLFLPGIFACIDKWDIEAVPPEQRGADTFLPVPVAPKTRLVAWLIKEISEELYKSTEVPND